MVRPIFILLLSLIFISCNSQTDPRVEDRKVGGPCEGCEAIYEYGDKILSPTATLPGFEHNEPKLLITGTVFQNDGKTPAKDVIIYIYQTNRQGIYESREKSNGWEIRHGYIRGWVKTGPDGHYTFKTFRPAAYPGREEPEHIHMTIKEPGKSEYYIDDVLFDDDPLLTSGKRSQLKNRGGSGIVKLELKNNRYLANRDIILGLNIPNYY